MPDITLDDGMRVLEAAFAKARSLDLVVGVSVVDARGDLVASARMDGSLWWWTESSRAKAMATVTYGGATQRRASGSGRMGPWPRPLYTCTRAAWLPNRARYPFLKGGKLVGAVGTAGGTGEEDEDISAAGASVVQ